MYGCPKGIHYFKWSPHLGVSLKPHRIQKSSPLPAYLTSWSGSFQQDRKWRAHWNLLHLHRSWNVDVTTWLHYCHCLIAFFTLFNLQCEKCNQTMATGWLHQNSSFHSALISVRMCSCTLKTRIGKKKMHTESCGKLPITSVWTLEMEARWLTHALGSFCKGDQVFQIQILCTSKYTLKKKNGYLPLTFESHPASKQLKDGMHGPPFRCIPMTTWWRVAGPKSPTELLGWEETWTWVSPVPIQHCNFVCRLFICVHIFSSKSPCVSNEFSHARWFGGLSPGDNSHSTTQVFLSWAPEASFSCACFRQPLIFLSSARFLMQLLQFPQSHVLEFISISTVYNSGIVWTCLYNFIFASKCTFSTLPI